MRLISYTELVSTDFSGLSGLRYIEQIAQRPFLLRMFQVAGEVLV